MNDRERITRLEIRCEQLQLTVNEAFHWIDILKSDLSDLQDRVGQADRKTENSSEKPNNSTISKMEQVEDEPQTCDDCIWNVCNYNKAFEDEPQTELKGSKRLVKGSEEETEIERLDRIDSEIEDAWARIRELTPLDETQTDCPWR